MSRLVKAILCQRRLYRQQYQCVNGKQTTLERLWIRKDAASKVVQLKLQRRFVEGVDEEVHLLHESM